MRWKIVLAVTATLALLAITAGSASASVDFRLAKHHAGANIEVACEEGPMFAKVVFREVVLGAGSKAQRHRAQRHATRRMLWVPNACREREEEAACERQQAEEVANGERWEVECWGESEEVAWHGSSRLFGLEASGDGNKVFLGLNFTETGGVIPLTEYRVAVKTIDGEEVRWLILRGERNGHYVKIWEGTDAFVNYCINRSKEIRSNHGRLFCRKWIPSTGEEMMAWRVRPLRS